MLTEEQANQIQFVRDAQRARSQKIAAKDLEERGNPLLQMEKMLNDNEVLWLNALEQDLGKNEIEAYASEIAVLLNEIEYIIKNLSKWMKPQTRSRLLFTGREKVVTRSHPYGSILVFAPWNYPLQLALMPVIGALAAGNGVVLKPSEFAPATSQLLTTLVPHYFEQEIFFVIEGNNKFAAELTKMEWDLIFFTGSQQTGQKVYQAAAQHLTPVLLELGGKNPCIIDETALNADTIQQIAWGKFINAGQSCIAPDTVYVPRKFHQEFLDQMKHQIQSFYGEQAKPSKYYGRIIHEEQLQKLVNFLEDGTVYYGGDYSKEDLFFSPTLMVNPKANSPLRTEEIFGPILPVIPYDSLDEVVNQINTLPTPLVVYIFSQKKDTIEIIEQQTESGALSINQVITHATSPHLPFGGKGKSGMGRYHGHASFQAFTYQRATYSLKSPVKLKKQYPPYSTTALCFLRKMRSKLF